MPEHNQADRRAREAADPHIEKESGARVPTPDPKDQTGDPDADNAAMRELHDRQQRRSATES